jgi:hypothetical protein
MHASHIGAIVTVIAALASVCGSARALEPSRLGQQPGPVRVLSAAASSTVLSTLVSREGQLVLLVLWRGSPGWLARGGGRASSQGGGDRSQTWVQLTRGELTLSVDVDHASGVARILKQTVSVKDQNVVLVDAVDTTPVVRTAHVDPAVSEEPDAVFAVLKREPALLVFLQCELMRADPFLKGILAAHPCGP